MVVVVVLVVESCEEAEKARPEIGRSQFSWAFRRPQRGKESGTET